MCIESHAGEAMEGERSVVCRFIILSACAMIATIGALCFSSSRNTNIGISRVIRARPSMRDSENHPV